MQHDTRNLTVAVEHMNSAYEEVMGARDFTEISMRRAALERAIGHLNLVLRRLEMTPDPGAERTPAVEAAFTSARRAWQGAHDILNDQDSGQGSVTAVIDDLLKARECLAEGYARAMEQDLLHA